jgi:hypothetical protein
LATGPGSVGRTRRLAVSHRDSSGPVPGSDGTTGTVQDCMVTSLSGGGD